MHACMHAYAREDHTLINVHNLFIQAQSLSSTILQINTHYKKNSIATLIYTGWFKKTLTLFFKFKLDTKWEDMWIVFQHIFNL